MVLPSKTSFGCQMVSSCGSNSWLISGNNSSVWEGNESTSWASGTYWDDTSGESMSWDWSNSWGSEWDCWSSNSWGGDSWASYSWYTITSTIGEYWGSGSIGSTSSSQMAYVSCVSDGWYGSKSWGSNGWTCTIYWSWGNSWYGGGGYKCWGMSSIDGTFGGQMVGSGSNNRWRIFWSNSFILTIWFVVFALLEDCELIPM